MSEIRPLRGIRYATSATAPDLTTRLAPPYDVLDERDKQALLARDPYNFVKLDLPHTPPKAAGPPGVYAEAARQLRAWLAEGVLVHDNAEALYVYHQTFTHAGRQYTRKMFFARLRLEPLGAGSVFPHEQTFGGPKEDRLALTKATAANLSPIFALYPDTENVIAQRLEQTLAGPPLARGQLDDTDNQLWAVADRGAIDAVARLMADRPLYIADGHHRYGTALLYRDWIASMQSAGAASDAPAASGQQAGAPLPPDHPANFVLTVLCAMDDPGLLILPTHRVLPGVTLTAEALKYTPETEVAHLLADGADDAIARLAKFGPQALGLWNASDQSFYMVRPQEPGLLDKLAPDRTPAWRRLALAFLHAYLIERLIPEKLTDGKPAEVQYLKDASAAVELARQTGGTAFLMQPTTMDELRAVCGAGDLMPQKSTFFYPKLASGLVVNPLD